jgi:hypothetical protein
MKQIFQLVILVMLAMYNAVCVVTGGVHLKKLVPSGVINNGILGGFSGKVGPVVGGKWKDIDYMRSYVIPSNPNTPAQQTSRAKFAALVEIARAFLPGLLQPYWDPFYNSMSGFNKFISYNYSLLSGANSLQAGCISSRGTLESITTPAPVYNTGPGTVVATWDQEVFGNGLLTDTVLILVYNKVTNLVLGINTDAIRDDETATVLVGSGLDETNLACAVFAIQGTGSSMTVSDSLFVDVTTP